jgi:K+-transporting ATPase ATPase A chain
MGATAAGVAFIASLIVALAVAYRPLGDYMYRVVTSAKLAAAT